MDKQNIELIKLREYAEKLDSAIEQTEKKITDLQAHGGEAERVEVLKRELARTKSKARDVKNVIRKETEFRQNRDNATLALSKVEAASKEVAGLLARVQDPEIIADSEEYNRTLDLLEKAYKEATGEDFDRARFERDREHGVKFVKSDVIHSRNKTRQALDSLYGNVDQDELESRKTAIDRLQKDYEGLVEKENKFNKADKLFSDYESLDDAKKADFKKKLKDLIEKNNEIAVKETKIEKKLVELEKLQSELKELEKQIGIKQKRYEELAKKEKRTPEEEKEFATLEKELKDLNRKRDGITKKISVAEKAVIKLRKEKETLVAERDSLIGQDPMLALANIPQELGLMDGDASFKIDPDKMDDLKFKVEEQRQKEDVDRKKASVSRNAAKILEVYGVALPTDGKFRDVLDAGVESIRKNYSPYHKQAGWEEVKKAPGKGEAEKTAEREGGAGGSEPPKGNANPVEKGGTRTPGGPTVSINHHGGGYVGNYSGPVFAGGHSTYGNGHAVHSQGASGVTPPAEKKEEKDEETSVVKEELVTGNDTREAYRAGIISYDPLEHFDISTDLRTLINEDGRRKVENGFVYRVMPIYQKGKGMEYVQVREPISEYTEGTKRKLKAEVNVMIDSLKGLPKEEQERLIAALSPRQQEQLTKVLHGNVFQRSGNKKDFVDDILSLPQETQVKLLIAYKTSAGFADYMMQATAHTMGDPLKDLIPSDLIMMMDGKGKNPEVIIQPKETKTLMDAYTSRKPQQRPEMRRTRTKSKEQEKEQEELDEI